MTKKSVSVNSDHKYGISYENYMNTNACTECTGLMANPASGKEEWDAYQDVFRFNTANVSSSSKNASCINNSKTGK